MPGRLIEVDGVCLHVVVEGSGPVVFFDSGLGGSSAEWAWVAADLRRDFTVVRYDRPGFGWSPPSPGDRRPLEAATRIRGLLSALDIETPVILVGHSLGGLHVRLAASLFPEIAAGIVLVDPSHEEMLDQTPVPRSAALMSKVLGAAAATAPLGTAYLVGRLYVRAAESQVRRPLDPRERDTLKRSSMLTAGSAAGLRAMRDELNALPGSLRQVAELTRQHPLAAIPLTVISADAPARTGPEQVARTAIRVLHEKQATATSHGRLVLAATSGHLVPLDQPELIAHCVRAIAALEAGGSGDPTPGALTVSSPPHTEGVSS